MTEYISEALILSKEPSGDQDLRISLFTKRFGKLRAKAKSARLISSKLSPHLQPGMVSEVRLIEKNELLIVDALKKFHVGGSPADAAFLDRMLPERECEPGLWHELLKKGFRWETILRFLGWDPAGASCVMCGGSSARAFYISGQELVCGFCASKFPRRDVVYIRSGAEVPMS